MKQNKVPQNPMDDGNGRRKRVQGKIIKGIAGFYYVFAKENRKEGSSMLTMLEFFFVYSTIKN